MSQHAQPTAQALNGPAQALLLTPLRQNIIRLHNHVLFSGTEKQASAAYLQANHNDYGRLLLWHQRLAQLVQEREDAAQGQHYEQGGYYDQDAA